MLFLLPSLRKTTGLMKVGASDMKIYVALPLNPLPREGDLLSLRSEFSDHFTESFLYLLVAFEVADVIAAARHFPGVDSCLT